MKCPRCSGTGETTDPETFADRLVMLRETARLSRTQVEIGANIPHSEYWRLEHGYTLNPQIKTLAALARFFKVTIDELLGIKGDP